MSANRPTLEEVTRAVKRRGFSLEMLSGYSRQERVELVNTVDAKGNHLLGFTAGNPSKVAQLYCAGAAYDGKDSDGETVYDCASTLAGRGNQRAIDVQNMYLQMARGETPLTFALSRNMYTEALLLLNEPEEDVKSTVTEDNVPVLHTAVAAINNDKDNPEIHAQILRAILSKDTSHLNTKSVTLGGATPLQSLVMSGRADLLTVLLEYNVKVTPQIGKLIDKSTAEGAQIYKLLNSHLTSLAALASKFGSPVHHSPQLTEQENLVNSHHQQPTVTLGV